MQETQRVARRAAKREAHGNLEFIRFLRAWCQFSQVLSAAGNLTRAGGLLAYQDDRHLIRLGAGIQYDGEVTLSAKAPDRALAIVGRGLLKTEKRCLRLERRGKRFTG